MLVLSVPVNGWFTEQGEIKLRQHIYIERARTDVCLFVCLMIVPALRVHANLSVGNKELNSLSSPGMSNTKHALTSCA